MKISSNELLAHLTAINNTNIASAMIFDTLPDEELNRKPSSVSWSILECLEHLNRYSAFYLPHLKNNMFSGNESPYFKSGFLGNYLVNMVNPERNNKKMKTFAAMNPSGSTLNREVLNVFIENQQELERILDVAHNSDLNRIIIPVTFTNLVKLKSGDALRFMVYHNKRHLGQALRLVKP